MSTYNNANFFNRVTKNCHFWFWKSNFKLCCKITMLVFKIYREVLAGWWNHANMKLILDRGLRNVHKTYHIFAKNDGSALLTKLRNKKWTEGYNISRNFYTNVKIGILWNAYHGINISTNLLPIGFCKNPETSRF